jgi:tRNA(fMet)-specific endonuclease VapC
MIDCCLDTCTVIDVMKGVRGVEPFVNRFTDLAVSHVVLGELLLGGHKASNPAERTKIFNALAGFTIISGDATTSDKYAEVRFQLEKQGSSIPQNDIWIAAVSLLLDVPLITRDEHFLRVRKLKVLNY